MRAVNTAAHGRSTMQSTTRSELQVGNGRGRIAAAGALALLALGCTMQPRRADAPPPLNASRAAREAQINAQWQNHPVRELIARWGPPRQVLDIPGGGNPPGFLLLYPRDAGTGCVDTFSVLYGAVARVRSYHCR
ncbi:hypothetical protein [Ramlibacter alkalitolerans]|uniref:Lipoprotein n=1 Tax=Ramlibacter alkalitolerans TaxID=2039631 RepID=A0ABS1JRA6_9BURK|nr:hypothetical protein [Ramlibacter alkalitolerans]